MYPPVFSVATSSSEVLNLLGSNPTRLYLFGEATQSTVKPYAVWQTVTGSPENYLKCPPDHDRFTVQVDVYGTTVSSVRDVAMALRDVFEGEENCYIVDWRGEQKEPATNLFRIGFDCDWHVFRA